ncbi:MAG: hypothetical protein ACOH1X_02060 [Kaistella sp.]
MNFSQLLFGFLKKQGRASVPGFGVFSLKTAHAILDKEEKNILPPGLEMSFINNAEDSDQSFAEFLASSNGISFSAAEAEIKKQVTFWNLTLEKEGSLYIPNFGNFFLDDSKVHFKEERNENLSPDFYGLEEINISEIKKARLPKTSAKENSYSFPKSVYWVLPLVLGVLALTYFGITQPEKIFGKKSFPNGLKDLPEKKSEAVSVKKNSAKVDSTTIDSAKADSLKSALIVPKAPVKKWSSKKYSKNKWTKKSKKRRNP